ncbi:MAG: hypothetical protein M5R36_13665 [Deltaproteobacteria bacterium]|nr:hypothetical protein [Deltaproteobacteria bacterium]
MRPLRTAHLTYDVVDKAASPLGEVMLRRYTADTGETGYEIRLGGNFLMATHGDSSERAMARLAHDMLGARDGVRVLIGGLGVSSTLREALELPGVTDVRVVEICEKSRRMEPPVVR